MSLGMIARYLDAVDALTNDGQDVWWYRGEAEIYPDPLPSLLRDSFYKQLENSVRLPGGRNTSEQIIHDARVESAEQIMNSEFRRFAAPLVKDASDLVEIYLLARHHGLPTRILDWTLTPLNALLFAVQDTLGTSDGRVWAMNPVGYHKFSLRGSLQGEVTPVHSSDFLFERQVVPLFNARPDEVTTRVSLRPIPAPDVPGNAGFHSSLSYKFTTVLPVLPDLTFSRIFGQDGALSFHPPANRLIASTSTHIPGLTEVFRIPHLDKARIRKDLFRMGLGPARLDPGLDGAAREVVARLMGAP